MMKAMTWMMSKMPLTANASSSTSLNHPQGLPQFRRTLRSKSPLAYRARRVPSPSRSRSPPLREMSRAVDHGDDGLVFSEILDLLGHGEVQPAVRHPLADQDRQLLVDNALGLHVTDTVHPLLDIEMVVRSRLQFLRRSATFCHAMCK
jgi:hypothetical protein